MNEGESRIIGVDVDDVLAHCVTSLLKFHNEKYGTSLEYHHVKVFDLWKVWGGTKEESYEKLKEFYLTKHFERMDPIEGAIEGINELSKNNKLIAITARPESTRLITENWIRSNFFNMFPDIYLVGEKNLKKSTVCLENGISVMIDDSLSNAKDCAENGIRTLLMDRPWNQDILPKGVERVFNWKEIIQKINS